MFDKFGEFDSVEELNRAAEGLKAEGDMDSLYALAVENGIDREDAQDYADGVIEEFATVLTAALGKIHVESEELKPVEIVQDWVEYIRIQCTENEDMAAAVRRKGRTVRGCIAELLTWSFKNCYEVDKEICTAAGVNGRVKMGIPGMGRAKQTIRKYYLTK